MDQFRIGVLARILVAEPLLIGEDHQQLGLNQVRDQRAEGIVVTKTDFIGDDSVVFVDHRHYPEVQQGTQGAAGVKVTMAVGEVVVGQQHLCGMQAKALETGLIGLDQAHLPDRRRSLLLMQGTGTFAPAQPAHSLGNGAG